MRIGFTQPGRTFTWFDALGVTGLAGLLVARFIPVAKLPFWGCILRQTTGWPCLGCGLTRAADRFSHGNVMGALEANPLGALAAGVFLVLAVWTVLHLAFKVPTLEVQLGERDWFWVRVGLVAALVLNYAFVVVKTRFPDLLT